jgi:hypothetical protein
MNIIKTTVAAAVIGAGIAPGALAAATTANAEPDINCATGQATGLDTASPGFVRPYPTVCVDKFLAYAHAENFTAPGGDTELVSLGKMACHSLDLDAADSGHAAENAVRVAEPKLTFTFTSGAEQYHDAGDELVRLAIKALCP